MSRKGTRQPVVLYYGHCHIKMSHHSVLGDCRYESRDNAGGKGFCNGDVAGALKGRSGEHARRKGSNGCGVAHCGERIKPWCGKGLRVRPRKQ